MIQWTPGSGVETTGNRRWYPLYHKTIEAGKKMFLYLETIEELEGLCREFGTRLKQFYLILNVPSLQDAGRVLSMVSD